MESTFCSPTNFDVDDSSLPGSNKKTAPYTFTVSATTFNMATKTSNSAFVPMPELTPDASPRSGTPDTLEAVPLRPFRRYAPQLVDNSRRARREGDLGLRPADRTDVTPYARHKSSNSKPKRRPAAGKDTNRRPRPQNIAVDDHESEDDFLLELAARRAERQLHEVALTAFPNSRPREGGAAHFYFRESDSETTASESHFPAQSSYARRRVRNRGAGLRRRSTDLGWWHKVMQEHAEQKVREWQTQHHETSDLDAGDVRDVESDPESVDWFREKVQVPEATANVDPRPSPPWEGEEPSGPKIVAPKPRAPHKEKKKLARVLGSEPQEAVDMEFEIMRRAASPPLLGDEIVFPRCASPEVCKISTDLPYTLRASEEKRRDVTQKSGLWGGYCYKTACKQTTTASATSITCASVLESQMLTPDSIADSCSYLSIVKRERGTVEPEQRVLSPPSTPVSAGLWGSCASRAPAQAPAPAATQSRGLNPFQGLGSVCRSPSPMGSAALARPKMTAGEKERRIAAEFDDHFVTQVYNYLSLGYPASARAFDEELCASVSELSLDDMRHDDEAVLAKGLVWDDEVEKLPEQGRCARWKALKAYIHDWAGAQEDLDELSPGFWGVGQRGSWRP